MEQKGSEEIIYSKRYERYKRKAEKAKQRTDKAKKRIPKQTKYHWERTYDDKTKKAKHHLKREKVDQKFKEDGFLKSGIKTVKSESIQFVHKKVAEYEDDNLGIESAHKTEQKVEDVHRFIKQHKGSKLRKRTDKFHKAQKVQYKKEAKWKYQQFLDENPKYKKMTPKHMFQKQLQKKRIQKEFIKNRRNRNAFGEMLHIIKGATRQSATIVYRIKQMLSIRRYIMGILMILAAIMIMLMTGISSCGTMLTSITTIVTAGAYQSKPEDLDDAEVYFTQLEADLQDTINHVERDKRGYDAYEYDIGEIGHDPFVLLSYLSAKYTEFKANQVREEERNLFNAMYKLTYTPKTETKIRREARTGIRRVWDTIHHRWKYETYTYYVNVRYTVHILKVKLKVTPLDQVIARRMNSEQQESYQTYMETRGMLQQFASPLDLNWYENIQSYFGYRINPITKRNEINRGLDISVPIGTKVFSAQKGNVIETGETAYYGKYITIKDEKGFITKYAFLNSISVSKGQQVEAGAEIGRTGNTGSARGSALHIECMKDGRYYNPLLYFDCVVPEENGNNANQNTRNGQVNVSALNINQDRISPQTYSDEKVQTLMNEATKYLGYPYHWGGSDSSTSFDCSGFVCYSFTHSGVYDLPRTTAQGIYDKCIKIEPEEAKAGDIIFFTGTYNSPGPVSHVGIYCGKGIMLHCGDPIQYSSINTAYWQGHFYGFGRIPK